VNIETKEDKQREVVSDLTPSWLRRGYGVGAGHAEHQFARKTTGNKVTANDQTYALAA
jgi:hypothetical protein